MMYSSFVTRLPAESRSDTNAILLRATALDLRERQDLVRELVREQARVVRLAV
jgi:hypothetical protein